ncbi:hypothetical protein, partial [Vibrio gazogenes]|uniref:hypothetical protein n=1 Tax=Vibrio gazogenes TaxID=687 RepID=UPI001A976544
VAFWSLKVSKKYGNSRIVSQSDPACLATANKIAHDTSIESQQGIIMIKLAMFSKNNPTRRGNGLFYPRLIVG